MDETAAQAGALSREDPRARRSLVGESLTRPSGRWAVGMVKDLPVIEQKLHTARRRLASCKTFIDDDAILEPVKVNANGRDLAEVRERIKDAQAKLDTLRAVPVPSTDIKARIEDYVGSLARPKVSGIAEGEALHVSWPGDAISVLALLLGDQMVEVLSQEVERMANDPMPLADRKERIGELAAEIDTLKRQAFALGADISGLPPEVVLGVKIVRREQVTRMKRRKRAESQKRAA
jgi:hypothetical protein